MVAEVPPVPALTTTQAGAGKAFQPHLREQALGNVVVAAPVGRPLGIGELVHVMAAGFVGDAARLVIDFGGLNEAHLAAEKLDGLDLLARRRTRGDGDEGQVQQTGEIGFGNGGGAGRGLHHRPAAADPAVAQAIEEERAGQTMLETA